MQTVNYDWNKFVLNNSWKENLDNINVSVFDTCIKITKEIGGNNKIKRIIMYCTMIEDFYEEKIEENNVTLLKQSKSLCFCKWDEYIISETSVADIKSIVFNKIYEDNQNKYYVLYLKDNNGFYWRYEIIT